MQNYSQLRAEVGSNPAFALEIQGSLSLCCLLSVYETFVRGDLLEAAPRGSVVQWGVTRQSHRCPGFVPISCVQVTRPLSARSATDKASMMRLPRERVLRIR